MNVGRLGSERNIPVAGIRVVMAGVLLLAAACAVFEIGSQSRPSTSKVVSQTSAGPSDVHATIEPASTNNSSFDGILNGPAASPRQLPSAEKQGELRVRARSILAGLPLRFEPNVGQANLDPADTRAKFIHRGAGYTLFLGSDGATLSLVSKQGAQKAKSQGNAQNAAKKQPVDTICVDSLEMKLAGANAHAKLTAADQLPGKTNYFIGNDASKWRSNVPQFARVRYEEIYPGINLVFYGNEGRLEYDFQVAPGANPSQAELEFNGAKRLELRDGVLVIHTEENSVQLAAPRVYQEVNGREQPVNSRFVLRGKNRAGFAIGSYDRSRELIIDPVLTFSTYFGGTGNEESTFVAVDGNLNVYLTGSTTSPALPVTTGVFQGALKGTQNVYIAKISPAFGSLTATLDNLTYLGGNGIDAPAGISVDSNGDPFLAGTTTSTNFPATGVTAYQSAIYSGSTGASHVFVTELANDFTKLQYSSYLSGNGTDVASGMTIDSLGDIFVTGTTTSNNVANAGAGVQFPASTNPSGQAFQIVSNGPIQFFVTEVNTTRSGPTSVAYSTYFGGSNFTPAPGTTLPTVIGGQIAVDNAGNVYFTGTTNFTYTNGSTGDFPIFNAYQPCLDLPQTTVIQNPVTCTYTGATPSQSDAFAAKLNLNAGVQPGQQLVWSTYLGGSGDDFGNGIALDPGAANVYIAGTTNSGDIATSVITLATSAPYQACLDQPGVLAANCDKTPPTANDAFVGRLSNPTPSTTTTLNNTALNYFSYLGGSGNEEGLAVAVDNNSGAVVTGWTQSTDFPVSPSPNSIQGTLDGTQNAFMARLNTAAVLGQTNGSWSNYFGGNGTDEGSSVVLDFNQAIYIAGDTNSTTLQVQKPLQATNAGGYDAFVSQFSPVVSLSITGVLTLGTNQTFISAGNQATFTYTITNNGPDLASSLTVIDNLSQTFTGWPVSFVSASASSGTCGGISTSAIVSCSLPSLQAGSTATVTIGLIPTSSNGANSVKFNGGPVQVTGPGNIVFAQTTVYAQMSDYSMQISPNNNSVPIAGDTAVYQIQLTPHPIYGSNVSLSCSGLPAATTCAFSPTTVTMPSSSGASSVLSIGTTARPIVTTSIHSLTRHFYAMWLIVPGLALLGLGVSADGRRRRAFWMLLLSALFAMTLLLPACTSTTTQPPVSGTPSGTYNITVTATSGSDTKSQTVVLSVP